MNYNIYLLSALLSAVLAGFASVGRWLAFQTFPPFFISGISWALGALVLGLFYGRSAGQELKKLNSSQLREVFYLATFNGAINGTLLAWLPAFTTASHASLFFRMEPYLILLIAWLRHNHKPSTPEMKLLTIHIGGALLISLGQDRASGDATYFGDLMAFIGVLISSACYESSRRVSSWIGPMSLSIIMALGSAIPLLLLHFIFESSENISGSTMNWIGLIFTIIYCIGTNPLLFFALHQVPAWKAAAFRVIGPLIALPLAWLLLNEHLNVIQLVGAACVLITTTTLARQKHTKA